MNVKQYFLRYYIIQLRSKVAIIIFINLIILSLSILFFSFFPQKTIAAGIWPNCTNQFSNGHYCTNYNFSPPYTDCYCTNDNRFAGEGGNLSCQNNSPNCPWPQGGGTTDCSAVSNVGCWCDCTWSCDGCSCDPECSSGGSGDGSYNAPYNGTYLPDFRVTSVGARNRNGNTQSYFLADSPRYNIDGDPIYVSVRILNDGNGYPGSSSRHAVYKDVDAYNNGSASMYVDSSNNWPPGTTATYQSWTGGILNDRFTSPFFKQRNAGRYRVYVKANYNNAVQEWNYSNNRGSSAVYEVRASLFGWVCWSLNEDAQCDDASGSTPADPLVSNIQISLYRDDNNNYGTFLATDTTVQTSNWNRSYAFDNLSAGDYLVRWDNPNWLPISSQARTATLGPHRRIRFAVKPAYRLWGYVFVDNDRDGVRDSDETVGFSGVRVRLSGEESRTTTTDANGMYEFTSLPRGTYTITITEPNGYKAYPSVSKQQVIIQNETKRNWRNDFGINRVYSITGRVYVDANQDGSYSAADDLAIGNQSVSLTRSSSASVVTSSDGVYSFARLEPGEYLVRTTPSSDYTVLTSLPLRVVITGGDVANQDIRFYGRYTISGVVFVDEDDSKTKNNQEQNYPANPQIAVTSSPTGAPVPQVVNNADGSYQVRGLISGKYTLVYSAVPLGYYVFHPRPALYAPRVGTICSPAPQSPGGSCDGNNNIVDLNFAIKAGQPWMQIYGVDVRFDEGLNDPVPPSPNAACGGAYVILPGSGGTPGVGFSGDLPPKLNLGSISSLGWLVGGVQYPSLFKPVRSKVIRTAYGYLMFAVGRGNVRTVNLSSVCDPANCTLPFSLASGIYTYTGNVNLNAFTFPANRDYIFLIDGDLRIRGQIRVPTTSTATFSVSEDILIDGSVGSSPPSCPPPAINSSDLEGFYSADRNFIVESSTQTNCSAGIIDKQLNVQGAIVVDAGQKTPGGTFINNRTFCTQNTDYPSFTLRARPDFILNAPEFIKRENFIWQEVAP